MTESTFKPGVFLPLIAVSLLFGILLFFLFYFIHLPGGYIALVIVVPLCLFFIVWISHGELRTKAVKVTIGVDRIKVAQFMGYGARKEYLLSEIEGYTLCLLPAEYRDYEYLYLIKDGKKVIKLSEFYHRNYLEMKNEIALKCKKMKPEKFSLISEWKEIWER